MNKFVMETIVRIQSAYDRSLRGGKFLQITFLTDVSGLTML